MLLFSGHDEFETGQFFLEQLHVNNKFVWLVKNQLLLLQILESSQTLLHVLKKETAKDKPQMSHSQGSVRDKTGTQTTWTCCADCILNMEMMKDSCWFILSVPVFLQATVHKNCHKNYLLLDCRDYASPEFYIPDCTVLL